ncbi:GAF domain-containing protein, partial [Streptomyces minutiscleroticus]|uniref:GAF domain-containing protein n=1 Tax=Streptomyces minutiscleroticus TaxID=68238 RepID=UPI003327ABD3
RHPWSPCCSRDDVRVEGALDQELHRLGTVPVGAVSSLPIINPNSQLVGMVSVHHDRPSRWPAEQRRRLHTLAHATGQLAQHSA